jgi:hypothetical protein
MKRNKQTLKEAGYKYIRFEKHTGLHILQDIETGRLEGFAANKNHASWGLIWRNTHLEFVLSNSIWKV